MTPGRDCGEEIAMGEGIVGRRNRLQSQDTAGVRCFYVIRLRSSAVMLLRSHAQKPRILSVLIRPLYVYVLYVLFVRKSFDV